MTVIPAGLGDDANTVARDQTSASEPLGPALGASLHSLAPVLITEQQVMLGSSIAISAPLPRHRGNPFRALLRTVRRVATWEPDEAAQDPHRNHAHRTPGWYSDALMAREMRRL